MKGFTLIEILVVLFIVSLLTGLVVANLPAFVSQADYEEEAERLKFVFEYGLETAQVDAVEIGVELATDSYGFVIFDESRQTWISSDLSELRYHELPQGLILELTTEGEPLRLVEPGEDADSTQEPQPELLLLSSGETSIFELSLVAEDGWWIGLSTEGFGDFTLSRTPIERDE
ncbi:MAG: type II secretion system minor pseudopilin GspH [Gammaproteobacteria bacterium]|jgi:general secretion pathway protein H|nr:type II secretion system minor pseudopilin GspH [Gammaproteobacteria bacterium]